MEDFTKFIGLLLIFTILFSIIVLFLSAPFVLLDRSSCYRTYTNMEKRYDLWSGCNIKVNNGWIPSSNYIENREVIK